MLLSQKESESKLSTTEVFSENYLFFCPYKSPLSIFHESEFAWSGNLFKSISDAYWWAIKNELRDVRSFNSLDDSDTKLPCPDKSMQLFVELYVAKLSQNEFERNILLNSGNRKIAACSSINELWTTGLTLDDSNVKQPENWKGENRLGSALDLAKIELSKH